MDTLTLVIILVLVGLALLLVLYPLWQQTRSDLKTSASGQTLEEYEARYQARLAAIKDLMFDFEMGKVLMEDYETLLNKTKVEAADIRRQIDMLSNKPTAPVRADLDAEIETMIVQYRNGNMADNEALLQAVNAEIELLKDAQPDAQPVCSACGKHLQTDDIFCSRCGQPVPTTESKTDVKTGFCPQCGHAVQAGDAFCVKCGAFFSKDVVED